MPYFLKKAICRKQIENVKHSMDKLEAICLR